MGKLKTEFKFFTIPQYREEEEYLSDMHRKGWKLTKINFPGLYHFEECKPENISYRLDYNQEGTAHKSEYVQLFADCGWEYMFDFVGYSYFRKAADQSDGNDEIFCDNESRLDMMKRVLKGRVAPLIVFFCWIILPQLYKNSTKFNAGSISWNIIYYILIFIGVLYLTLFAIFTVQFRSYEKRLFPEKKINLKYTAIMTVICLGFVLLGGSLAYSHSSSFTVNDIPEGFQISAERLNTAVEREVELKKGDIVEVAHTNNGGCWYLSIAEEGKEPVFFGNTYGAFDPFTVTIPEDGRYTIKCSGKQARGIITVTCSE